MLVRTECRYNLVDSDARALVSMGVPWPSASCTSLYCLTPSQVESLASPPRGDCSRGEGLQLPVTSCSPPLSPPFRTGWRRVGCSVMPEGWSVVPGDGLPLVLPQKDPSPSHITGALGTPVMCSLLSWERRDV